MMTNEELNAIEASHPDPLGDRHNVYRLLNEVRRLREALEPFARMADGWGDTRGYPTVYREDVERARAALVGGR